MQVIPFKPSYYELWMVAWDASSKVKISSANPFEDPQCEPELLARDLRRSHQDAEISVGQ